MADITTAITKTAMIPFAPRRVLPATAVRRAALAATAATLAVLAACGTPADLDLSRDKPTDAGLYRVAVAPAASGVPAVNQMHAWTVRLATPQGRPVTGARFTVGGGMPQHGHGLPTQPRVTRELADGTYLLEGMKFSMTGWWELRLDVQAEGGPDRVTFNLVVDPRTPRS